MKRVGLFTVLLMFITLSVKSQMVRIGLYGDEVVRSVVVSCSNGEYIIYNGEERVGDFRQGDILFVTLENGVLNLHNATRVFGSFESVELKSISLNGIFRIRPVDPALKSRVYDDDLILKATAEFINIINRVDYDKYIAGVLESELGPNVPKELYKAHALLTRTYMLNSMSKHTEEDFSLCDGVHCQAYHGRAVYNPEISRAVFETSGEVVTDFHYKLINAVYHSNSGGETQRASDVWLSDIDYLQAVVDPYSLHQPQAKWYDTIYFDDWKAYLKKNGMKAVDKLPQEILYVQQRHRRKYLILDQDTLLMTRIRDDWNFRSTFFNMFPDENGKIIVWGKGYGHGVGLSQEGAKKMAELGFNYKDIIKFYFFNVRIMNYEDLPRSSLPEQLQ